MIFEILLKVNSHDIPVRVFVEFPTFQSKFQIEHSGLLYDGKIWNLLLSLPIPLDESAQQNLSSPVISSTPQKVGGF